MRICTAPTPFDRISPEDRQAWLNQAPTRALYESVLERILELRKHLCENIQMSSSDTDVAITYRALRYQFEAYAALRDWLLSAEVPRG